MPPTWPWQKSSAHHQETLDRPSTSLAESLLLGPKPWPLGEAGPPGAKPLGPLHPSRCSGLQQTLAARERLEMQESPSIWTVMNRLSVAANPSQLGSQPGVALSLGQFLQPWDVSGALALL